MTAQIHATSAHEAYDGACTLFFGNQNLKLRATRTGVQNSPVVPLLHGGGQTRHAWSDTGRALSAADYIDARGHGDSEWCPRGDYSACAQSGDLRADSNHCLAPHNCWRINDAV